MSGKKIFTSEEVKIIKILLRQKAQATKSEQKKVRAKMRDLKFYITDFDKSQTGFTVIDFENLIKNKRITVSDKISPDSIQLHKTISIKQSNRIDFESLRKSYKPNSVRVLYIAESPPSGGTFFYATNSNLFNCIKKAFINVFGDIFFDNLTFLKFFMANNFYLDDLCIEPVNDKTDSERKVLRREGIEPLSKRIISHSPDAIIILMKGIETEVKLAISKSNLNIKNIFVTPFPSFSQANKDNCINENKEILEGLIELGVINKSNT